MSDLMDVLESRLEDLEKWESNISRPLEQQMIEQEREEIKAEMKEIRD